MNRPAIHFFNLDVLRAVAVIMVFIYHGMLAYSGWFHKPAFLDAETTGKPWQHFFDNMSMGVDFFFLISGFLITYLLLTEKQSTGQISIGKFYVRRVLRIWPLYFLIIAITPFICQWSDSPSPHYLGTIFFVNNFEAIHLGHMDYPFVHFWTLSIEEQFYLLWPLLLAFIPREKLPHLFFTIIVAGLIYKIYAAANASDPMIAVAYHTLSRGDAIVFGSLLAWIHHRSPIRLNVPAWIRVAVFVVMIAGMFLFYGISTDSYFELVFARYFFLAAFIFFLLNYLFGAKAVGAFTKKNFLHYIGKISFGIYIFHNILLPIIIKRLLYKWETTSMLVFWLVYIASTLIVSVLSYELIEKRILRLKDRFAVVRSER